jgi:hypothetical protein
MSIDEYIGPAHMLHNLKFGTKAATLAKLRQQLTLASVCQCVIFSVGQWRSRQDLVVKDIQQRFGAVLTIVRSSAINEDGHVASMAGAFDSVPNVNSASKGAIILAVEQVIASYGPNGEDGNEVLVQPMISDVSMSGVIFSHDLSTGAPYYVINYDDQSGLTDTVTSGSTDTSRTLLVYRNQVGQLQSRRFLALIRAVQEIEALTSALGLDIEFAVTRDEEIYIFQVRPMAVSNSWNPDISRKVATSLAEIHLFLESRFRPIQGVLGNTSLFGEMPDWNPAEMIGSVPRPLAHSLYDYLITNSSWAVARAELGYADLTGRPLMVSLGGRVFIDVRESFNSFLPASLPTEIGEKLICTWLSKLKRSPELHDKVEFDVATTALSLSFEEETEPLADVLTPAEHQCFRSALLKLTDDIIQGRLANGDVQRTRIAGLNERRRRNSEIGKNAPLDVVRQLLQDCIKNGTIPFAIMARRGFIAESMLRSIEKRRFLTSARIAEFKNSVPTVLTDFLIAMRSCQNDISLWESFMETYGHLRPGTYDILATRYDQHQELVEVGLQEPESESAPRAEFTLFAEELSKLDDALMAAGFSFGVEVLFDFMREAIAGREYAKLVFSRNISDALELIASWGEGVGLSRDELSYLTIEEILRTLVCTTHEPIEIHFRNLAKVARQAYEVSQALRLPYLISEPSDIYVVPMLKSRPNFVTSQRIQAPLHYLSDHAFESTHCTGKIVMIERADPGYDWIFLSKIAGLITKYGGANSHMAIRCAELDIPAAIGCGEQIFEQAKQSDSLLLDCAAGLIVPIH